MGGRKETNIEERNLIAKFALKGKFLRKTAEIVGRSHTTIQEIVNKFKYDGIVQYKKGRGWKPILSERDE